MDKFVKYFLKLFASEPVPEMYVRKHVHLTNVEYVALFRAFNGVYK